MPEHCHAGALPCRDIAVSTNSDFTSLQPISVSSVCQFTDKPIFEYIIKLNNSDYEQHEID